MNGVTLFKKQQVPVYSFVEYCQRFLLSFFIYILTPKPCSNGKFFMYSLFYGTHVPLECFMASENLPAEEFWKVRSFSASSLYL